MVFHGNFQTAPSCYRLFPLMLDTAAQQTDAFTLPTSNPPCLPGAQAAELLREHCGPVPDNVTMCKTMANGHPVKGVNNDCHDRGVSQ